MGTESEKGDVNEILKAQRKFEERQLQKKEEAEKEDKRQADLQAQAGDNYDERGKVLPDLNASATELQEMEAGNIEERIDTTKAKKEERLTKEEELNATKATLEELRNKFQIYENAAKEAKDKNLDISQELSEAMKELGDKLEELEGQAETITTNIEEIKAEEVPDEEMQRYAQLKTDVKSLDNRMQELESNPALVEMLHDEALVQNQVIDQVIEKALIISGIEPDNLSEERKDDIKEERKDYIKSVCTKFIREEIAATGIDQITDKKERTSALEKLGENMVAGLKTKSPEDISRRKFADDKMPDSVVRGQLSGLALASLIGSYGSMPLYRMAEIVMNHRPDDRDTPILNDRRRVASFVQVKKHLETINFMRAYATGLGPVAEIKGRADNVVKGIMGGASDVNDPGQWNDISKDLGFVVGGKPILPPELSEHQRQTLTAQFEKDLKRGREVAERIYLRTKEANETRLAALNQELQSAEEEIKKLDDLKKTIESHGEPIDINKKIIDKETRFRQEKRRLEDMNLKLKLMGSFSFRAKRRLQNDISSVENTIATIEKNLSELKEQLQASNNLHEQIGSDNEYQIKRGNLYSKKSELEKEIEATERAL